MSHLKEINETYFQHLRFAWKVAVVLLVHGLFPNLWQNKARTMMDNRHE